MNSPDIPPAQSELGGAPPESALRYYVFGFHRALRSYRTMTMLGWGVVATGCSCAFLILTSGRLLGPFGIVMASATVLAGLTLVWQSISTLESYLRITLPFSSLETSHPIVASAVEIMQKVDDGGWQDAYAAIQSVEDLKQRFGLEARE